MTGRVSLVEQKRLQWAKEREEMAKLNAHWESMKNSIPVRNTIRTRLSSREVTGKPLRASGQYGSTTSLRSFDTGSTSLQSLDFSAGGSMINILERTTDFQGSVKKRSPSLPPIYTKDHHQNHNSSDNQALGLEVEGSRYTNRPGGQKHTHSESDRNVLPQCNTFEEREGETSGYASDSIEPPRGVQMTDGKKLLPLDRNQVSNEIPERNWKNLYSDTSLPSSKRFSTTRLNELNRPRWGSIWNEDNHHSDPPPPSWLERGLSRLDHTSQILVINHDSASSPDSSTTGSMGSDTKTYLRGQNIPVDAHILQEREAKRLKALELQNAIKQQLEEKDRKRKEDRENKLREEREEDERIRRERDMEKERFEEEQRRQKQREDAKIKKEMAMKEILENAERVAKEEKRQKRQRDDFSINGKISGTENRECKNITEDPKKVDGMNFEKFDSKRLDNEAMKSEKLDKGNEEVRENHLRLPLNKEVAIVLTGRLEDSDILSGKNLQLLNLIVNSTPRDNNKSTLINSSISELVKNNGSTRFSQSSSDSILSPRMRENRLLTPSKYRNSGGRDFGTQTDCENDNCDVNQKDGSKDRKELVNISRRDDEKGTNTGSTDDKNTRSKSQPRTSIDSRPRWNANRPGTRYRTQSEKDPHYQKRLRLRRRQVESSDERSRSPSPDRRKSINIKPKIRNSTRRKVKLENYDADLSMDSLNSVVPVRIDENGRINVELTENKMNNPRNSHDYRNKIDKIESDGKLDLWCSQEILSQLAALRNGLLLKQREWETERCLVSPNTDFL